MTLLCVPIFVQDVEAAHAAAARAAENGADLVEYRIDAFTDEPHAVTALVEHSPTPCIITCRSATEGGLFDGDEMTRISVLEHAGLANRPPLYIDIELAAYQRSANLRQKVNLVVDHEHQQRQVSTGLILSAHDFDRRPHDLLRRIAAMAEAPACRVIKVAWQARSLRDNLEAFDMLRQQFKPTIALCMGQFGLASRVLAKKFGALLTFAKLDDEAGTAPGQPSVSQIKRLYRWDALQSDTAVYGVIGWPVGHSMSPAIHNAGFDATGFNGVYLPMPIPPEYEHFKATAGDWLAMDSLHFRGASVTIPHKENLLRFVREQGGEIEPLAERIGAANTLTVGEGGSLYASNTDYAAALDAVCAAMGIARGELAGKRVAVIGAGGAARAVVAGFAAHGATVVIYNRTREKAENLADELRDVASSGHSAPAGAGKVVAAPFEKLCDTCCDVFINCTPIGMHPNVDASPLDFGKGRVGGGDNTGKVIFDTIYNPPRTKLLRDAEEAGYTTVSGTEMFLRQAAAQFELWTDQPAPLDRFYQVLAAHLNEKI